TSPPLTRPMSSASLLSSGFPAETVWAVGRGVLEAYIVAAGLAGSRLRSSSIRRFVIWRISYCEDSFLNSQIRRGPGSVDTRNLLVFAGQFVRPDLELPELGRGALS